MIGTNFLKIVSFAVFFVSMSSCVNEPRPSEKEQETRLLEQAIQLKESSKDSITAQNLTSVVEVKNWLEQKEDFAIIEVSKKEEYQKGHLPNAIHLWRPDYTDKDNYPYSGMRISRERMEELFGEKGIRTNQKIVLYDAKGSSDAMRLGWLLKAYGHENFFIMNGGKTAWKKSQFALDTLLFSPKEKTEYAFSSAPDYSKIATLEEVKAAINNPEYILIDTREPEEYKGQPYLSKGEIHLWKKGAFTYGCIPSAVHLNWSDAVDLKEDHRIKSLKDLKYNLERAGISPDKKIITYCQSGVRSSHTTFILTEILGYENVKNYDGSWIEWTYNFVNKNNVEIERHTSEEEYARLEIELKEEK